jgi:drug/metabolite transporter (DMT)-like permease
VSGLDLALVLFSALLHASWNAVAKGSRDVLAFSLLMAVIPAAAAPLLLPFVDLGDVPPSVWWLTAATAVAHALYFFWLALAYREGDLSLVYPISRSTPALVALTAVPLLGESLSAIGVAGIAMVMAGMWLLQTGGIVRWHALIEPGARYAYLALGATVVFTLIDKRAMAILSAVDWHGAAPPAVVFYFVFCTACVPFFVPLALSRLGRASLAETLRRDLPRALGASTVSFVSYGLVLQALGRAPASYVAAVRQTSVLFAVALGTLWLRERPGRARLLGALATVAGVVVIALRG